MTETFEQNKMVKLLILSIMLILMLFMVYQFPSSQATVEDSEIVSIR